MRLALWRDDMNGKMRNHFYIFFCTNHHIFGWRMVNKSLRCSKCSVVERLLRCSICLTVLLVLLLLPPLLLVLSWLNVTDALIKLFWIEALLDSEISEVRQLVHKHFGDMSCLKSKKTTCLPVDGMSHKVNPLPPLQSCLPMPEREGLWYQELLYPLQRGRASGSM